MVVAIVIVSVLLLVPVLLLGYLATHRTDEPAFKDKRIMDIFTQSGPWGG